MDNDIKEKVDKILSGIKHPTIDASLIELGIIKNNDFKENKILITMAFPFPGIPIKDYLINSVQEALKTIGFEIEINTEIMNQKELQRFLSIEQKKWKA